MAEWSKAVDLSLVSDDFEEPLLERSARVRTSSVTLCLFFPFALLRPDIVEEDLGKHPLFWEHNTLLNVEYRSVSGSVD